MKDIYELELLEETFLEKDRLDPRSNSVRRVPGGWIFTEFHDSQNESNDRHTAISSVFVPHNDEFKEKKRG